MTLTFDPLRAMVMTYLRAKVQGQRSVGSEDRVKTNGRTDGGDLFSYLDNSPAHGRQHKALKLSLIHI